MCLPHAGRIGHRTDTAGPYLEACRQQHGRAPALARQPSIPLVTYDRQRNLGLRARELLFGAPPRDPARRGFSHVLCGAVSTKSGPSRASVERLPVRGSPSNLLWHSSTFLSPETLLRHKLQTHYLRVLGCSPLIRRSFPEINILTFLVSSFPAFQVQPH